MGSGEWLRRYSVRNGAGQLIGVKRVDIFRPLVGLSAVDMTAQILEAAVAGQRHYSRACTKLLSRLGNDSASQSRQPNGNS